MSASPALFILSSDNDRLLSVDVNGRVQAVPGLEDLAVADVVAGAAGTLWLATRGLPGTLVKFETGTRTANAVAAAQGGDEGFAALDRGTDGTLYCSEYRHGRANVVTTYAADGHYLGSRVDLSGFCGFAVSARGEIVTPTFRASAAGTILVRYGAGWAEEEPRGIAVSAEGAVAIALPESRCVVITDLDGHEKTRLTHAELKLPRGVCFHGAELLVTCLKTHRVLRFDLRGGPGAVLLQDPVLAGPGRILVA